MLATTLFESFLWWGFIFVLYFAPSLIAANRKVPSVGSVVVVNVFLGWTFIGWVVALAMAARTPAVQPSEPDRSFRLTK